VSRGIRGRVFVGMVKEGCFSVRFSEERRRDWCWNGGILGRVVFEREVEELVEGGSGGGGMGGRFGGAGVGHGGG